MPPFSDSLLFHGHFSVIVNERVFWFTDHRSSLSPCAAPGWQLSQNSTGMPLSRYSYLFLFACPEHVYLREHTPATEENHSNERQHLITFLCSSHISRRQHRVTSCAAERRPYHSIWAQSLEVGCATESDNYCAAAGHVGRART